MNIFKHLDYREIIKEVVENRKKVDPSINYQNMSSFMLIQKAYLSQVIKNKRDLNQDQLYKAAQYLKFNDEEYDYLQLLLEYERSGIQERKKELKKQIVKIQKKHSKTSKYIPVDEIEINKTDRDEYYLDPIVQLVHVALNISKYNKDPLLLAEHFMIPKKRIQNALSSLERMKVISIKNDKIKVEINNVHLSRDSLVFHPWKTALNNLCMNKIRNIDNEFTYNFSAVFATSEKCRKEIYQEFMNFLNKAKAISDKGKQEDLCQINFDLFNWTK